MDIEATIIKARELLEEIPGVDSILGAWDVYCAHIAGPWVSFGPFPEDGCNSPNPKDQQIAMKMLVDIYDRLAPFEDRIISLFNTLDHAYLSYRDESVKHKLGCLKTYCNDFHINEITMRALGLLAGQEQTRKQKQPSPKKQSKTIKDYILLQDEEQKDKLLKVLHSLLDNKLGRWAGLVVAISVKMGLLVKPTFKMVVAEFGDIGNESGFNKYYKLGGKAYDGNSKRASFEEDEIKTIKDNFSCFVTQDNSAK